MYITARVKGKPRGLHDHEQLELLLESFTKQVEEIVSEVDTTVVSRVLLSSDDATDDDFVDQYAVDTRDHRAHAGLRAECSSSVGYQSVDGYPWYRFWGSYSRALRHECKSCSAA